MLSWLHALAVPSLAHWLLIVASSLVLEDPTTLYVAKILSTGEASWAYGFAALLVGLSLGDVGLYAVGCGVRFGRRTPPAAPPATMSGLAGVFAARFVPGLRVVVYGYAGYRKMPLVPFVLVNLLSGAIWSALLIATGGTLYRRFGWWGIGGAAALVLGVSVVQRVRFRRSPLSDNRTPDAPATHKDSE